jgi:C4-dicarboxylate-specific signal transduction histidine kinase
MLGLASEFALPSYELFFQMVHEADRNELRQSFESAVRRGDNFEADYRIVRPDGSVRHFHAISHPVLNEAGEPSEYVGTAIDTTERIRAEEALLATNEKLAHITRLMSMGEITASIAHEVNQPLAAIVAHGNACLRWLAAEPPNLKETRTAVERVIGDANRASDVIARIRGFLRRGTPRIERVRVEEMIDEVIGFVRDQARRYGVSLRTDSEPALPTVEVDRVQIQQVILNLVMNAIEAMSSVAGRGRNLVIAARRYAPDAVVVSVRDSGMALEPQQRERIFEAFYSTKPEGIGMGLTISRTIVEAHGGRLWAMPNHDAGETFQFTLPLA